MDSRTDNTPGTAENPVVMPAKEARQGNRGLPVMGVLIVGLALVIIAYVIIYFVVPAPTGVQ